jgi:hypothetical protein
MALTPKQMSNALALTDQFGDLAVGLIRVQSENTLDQVNGQMSDLYADYQAKQQQDPENGQIFDDYQKQIKDLVSKAPLVPAYSRQLQSHTESSLAAQRSDFQRVQFQAQAKRGLSTTFQVLANELSKSTSDPDALKAQLQDAYQKGSDRLVGAGFLRDYEYNQAFSKLADGALLTQSEAYAQGIASQLFNANMPIEDIEKTINEKTDEFLSKFGSVDASPDIAVANLINKDQDDSTKLRMSDDTKAELQKFIGRRVKDIQSQRKEILGKHKDKLVLSLSLNELGSFLGSSEVSQNIDQETYNAWIMQYLSLCESGSSGAHKEEERLTDEYKKKDLELLQSGATPEQRLQLNVKYTGLGASPDALASHYKEITDTSFSNNWEIKGAIDKLGDLTKQDKNGHQKMDQGGAAAILENLSSFYQANPDAKPGTLTELFNNLVNRKTDAERQKAIYKAVNPGWLPWMDKLGISDLEQYQKLIETGKVAVKINLDGKLMTPNPDAVTDSQISQVSKLAAAMKLSDTDMLKQLSPRIVTISNKKIDAENPDQSSMPGQTIVDDYKNGFTYRYHLGKGNALIQQVYNVKTQQWDNYDKKKKYQSWLADTGKTNNWNTLDWKAKRDAWGTH